MSRGRPRKYTDGQIEALRAWTPRSGRMFWQLCMDLGVSSAEVGRKIRRYPYKMPSPRMGGAA